MAITSQQHTVFCLNKTCKKNKHTNLIFFSLILYGCPFLPRNKKYKKGNYNFLFHNFSLTIARLYFTILTFLAVLTSESTFCNSKKKVRLVRYNPTILRKTVTEFMSCNSAIFSWNCKFISSNSEFISHNSDFSV